MRTRARWSARSSSHPWNSSVRRTVNTKRLYPNGYCRQGHRATLRIALEKAFSDGTVAVDLDPLSLLSRLCASVPPPRLHTVWRLRERGQLAFARAARGRRRGSAGGERCTL
jgi:hypothetical protein